MAAADLPHDGRGGYLYMSPISVPNYANTTVYTSYSALDGYLSTGSASATTFSVTLGACLMTLIHVLVFTMPDKRWRIIFNCIVVGLFLEVIRQFCAIWAVTRAGTYSSYFLLTLPSSNATESEYLAAEAANAYTNLSLGTKVNTTIDGLASLLAFIATQICFYVLVNAMMSAMRRKTIRIAIMSLAGLGFHAGVWRLVQSIWETVAVFHQTTIAPPPWFLSLGTEIAYTISVCAWCLVYSYLIIRSALARVRLGLEFKRGEARHIMIMTALESMIIPIIFMVLQWLPISWFPEPEYCIVPSILILLPFGTLWASSFDPNEAHRGHVGRYQSSESRSATAHGSHPTASGGNSASASSPSQPLFNRKATRPSGLTTTRSNPDPDEITPLPTPKTLAGTHPFEDLYSDADSEGTIRIRRQAAIIV